MEKNGEEDADNFLTLHLDHIDGLCNKPSWVQEGKTKQDMKYGKVDCYESLLKEHDTFPGFADKEIRDLMATCMGAKGYHDESKAKY